MSLRKALGLTFFAALALMAITAPGASATAGELKILDATKTTLSELNATLNGEVDLLGVLDVPAINLEIDCTGFEVKEGTYLASDNVGHGSVLYKGCTVYGTSPSLTALAGCEVYPTAADRTAGTNKGHITASALLTILLHKNAGGGEDIQIIAKPSAGGVFTKIFFKNCPTGSSADVTGELAGLVHTTGHLVKHLVEEATEKLGKQLKYGENNANILGALWVFLTGEHAGREWGLI
jgi:hypothetical protein